MTQEFRHHLELRTGDLIRAGLTPEQAARQARVEFGHLGGHLIAARASRGLAFFDQLRFSALDIRLGIRMLAKYPVLSLVSVVGMAVAIAIGAGVFSILASMTGTKLPLPEGDRVVALRSAILTHPGQSQASLRDFLAWRDELGSVRDVAAFTTTRRNLVIPHVTVELVRVTRMTASGFRVARTAPLLGRPLLDEDERNDAHVVVIGFEEWQRRFAADSGIIGRPVRLGSEIYTIVGVMPEGFRFPLDDRYWIPLVIGPSERERAGEIAVTTMGRLTDGVSFERAQLELDYIGTRMAAAYPETHAQLRPQVIPYTRAFFDVDDPGQVSLARLFQFFVSLLLVVVAVNVAILVYARTATRVGELAVRTALGASRARVVTQLFGEALVLSGTAAVIGLAIAGAALAELQMLAERRLGELPFWVNLGLSPGVITYVLVLAVVGASIVGIVPALKATGRRVQTSLQQLSQRGSRMQLGRAWTALIIAQVALAVAVLPFAVHFNQEVAAYATRDVGYPAAEFLVSSLNIERADALPGCERRLCDQPDSTASATMHRALEQRFSARVGELIRRLEADPAVAGLTIRMPRSYERVEIEDIASPDAERRSRSSHTESIDRVDANFFALYGMPILAGRTFTEADARGGPSAVVVNHVYAEHRQDSGAVLGRRLRFVHESENSSGVKPGAWLEIVGVVRDFESSGPEPEERIYLPAGVAELRPPIDLVARVRVDPATSFAPRLREIAAAVDPELQLDRLASATTREREARQLSRFLAIGTTVVTLSVLLLSAAGIYAMMSFTVARRRREIGIRAALGAEPRRVLRSIFARASVQLVTGMSLGLIGSVVVDRLAGRGPVHEGNLVVLPLVVVLMATVGLAASLGPARRGLAVQPTEALREE